MTIVTKDVLQDLINHTLAVGELELLKITGSATETTISAVAGNRSVIMTSKFKTPIPAFIGTFGMPNLSKLKTILSFSDEYDENAKITVNTQTYNGAVVPSSIHFENKSGDFVNDYRLMSQALVEEQVKNVMFKGANWNVDFQPMVTSVQRLKKQASVHNDELVFTTKLISTGLQVSFGDPATHNSNFIFHSYLPGKLSASLSWPVKQFLSIMDLLGDKHVYISDQGVMKITVDSGIAVYEYLLPAQAK